MNYESLENKIFHIIINNQGRVSAHDIAVKIMAAIKEEE